MHNAAFRELGLDDWRYEAIDVEPERFDAGRARAGGAGLRRRQRHDPAQAARARGCRHGKRRSREAVGAANTLVFARRRRCMPTTPTWQGFLTALRERAPEAPGGHAGAGAGRGRRRPGRRLRAAARRARPRWRSGTATPSGPRRWLPTWPVPATAPIWPPPPRPSLDQTDLLVNATSVGMVEPRPRPQMHRGNRTPSRSYR